MSEPVFPVLPGVSFGNGKSAIWSTTVIESFSGIEQRIANWSYPRWRFKLSYEVLRDKPTQDEFWTLVGFICARKGRFESFLFEDTTDNTATAQTIGTGNGSTVAFQLSRTKGDFVEPIRAPKAVSEVRVNGVVVSPSNYSVNYSTGTITFGSAPANGNSVEADFTFYFRCRFEEDEISFEQIAKQLWAGQSVEFRSEK